MTVITSGYLQNSGVNVTLAPDLSWPSRATSAGIEVITGLNMQGSLQTALSLTGKHALSFLYLTNLTAETCTIKLTIDGVVIWNSTFTTGTTLPLLGNINGYTAGNNDLIVQVNNSLLLEIQTASDTSIDLAFIARPIL